MADGCVGDCKIQNWIYTFFRIVWAVGFVTDFVVLRGVHGAPYIQVRTAIGLKAKLPCSTDITGLIHVQWLDPSGTTLTYDETVETGDSRFKINHSYLKEWNLEIDNVRKSDAGNYTCKIGPTPLINNEVELIIVVAPSIISSSVDASFLVGSSVNLTCLASGDPQPTISWGRLSKSNGDKIDMVFEGTTFEIPTIGVEDAGTYVCQAINGVAPNAFQRMRIDVLFPPAMSVMFREVSQDQGASTLIACLVKANPVTDLYWERGGQRLVESSPKYRVQKWGDVGEYQTTLGLFIDGLVGEDFGAYKCIATNEFGRAEEKILIHEFHTSSVRVLATPKDSLARVGADVLFDCKVHGIDEDNSLSWWFVQQDGEYRRIFVSHPVDFVVNSTNRSTIEADLFNSTKYKIQGQYGLLVKNIEFNDSGTYVCDINGQQNYSALLTVFEFQESSVRILATPKDSLARVDADVLLDCEVRGIDEDNSLSWWYVRKDGEYRRIFVSHPVDFVVNSTNRSTIEGDLFNSTKYEIHGQYGLLVRNIEFNDSGMYVCDINGQQNYSALLTVVDSSLSCENNRTRVNDEDTVLLVCSIAFRGLASDFSIVWLHDEEPVESRRVDDVSRVRRTLVFNASYPQSTGVYRCYVHSLRLNYSATCRTELIVLSPQMAGFIFPCFNLNTTTISENSTTDAIIIISLVSAAVGLLNIYIITVCCLVTAHRRELAKYKLPQQKEKSSKNGNVDVELMPLTCTTPPSSA